MTRSAVLPLTVIGGYLGAGKTTLVNEILARPDGVRYGVIVNDLGEIAVDTALIESADDDTVTLGNGCICCSVVDGLQVALDTLRERDLDHVVIEVSGVGDPWKVAQWGRTPGFELDAVLVLADVETVRERATDRYVGDTVRTQLAGGDLVVLTKLDLVDADDVDAVTRWMARHSDAPIVAPPLGARVIVDLLGAARPGTGVDGAAHAHHRSWSVRPGAAARVRWNEWLGSAPAGVLRAKGVVDSDDDVQLTLQLVGRRAEVTRYRGAAVESQLVAIATDAADPDPVERWLAEVAGSG